MVMKGFNMNFFSRKLAYYKLNKENSKVNDENKPKSLLERDIETNITKFKIKFNEMPDVTVRQFEIGYENKIQCAIIFLQGMVDKKIVNESILKPLLYDSFLKQESQKIMPKNINSIDWFIKNIISIDNVSKSKDFDKTVIKCLSGYTIMLIDSYDEAILLDTKGWEGRSVEEPKTESVVRGPREGFTESIYTNTQLLRRKIKNTNLKLENMTLGVQSNTEVSIAYIKGIANTDIVEELRKRLNRIKIDAILESEYVEEFIEDAPYSLFPTVAHSEKPDVIAAKLLEGRIAIFVDGTPFVMTVPMFFIENFQVSEDYYSRPYYTSFLRILRFISYLIALLGPCIYVALTSFHQELIPTPLLITMLGASEGTPFPTILETLGMMITFEILKEAGVRLPRAIGQAISIVGALVIGEAAVSAGFIAAQLVIVVAITAICSFVIPEQVDSITVLRLILIIISGILGGYGIIVSLIWMYIYLCSLRSFGMPYMSPIAPFNLKDMKDFFIRVPIWMMNNRPKLMTENQKKQGADLKPSLPEDKKNKE